VPVPDACSETCQAHQWCPNYSSSLLIARNGAQVLEFASDWTDRGCFSSYAWGSWSRDASLSRNPLNQESSNDTDIVLGY
jgi:hypothetical protein